MRPSPLPFTMLVLCLIVSAPTVAQSLGGLEQGTKPYGSYEGGDIDSISTVNGSLTLHIPLISFPQRGGRLHVSFSLVYSNPWLQPWATGCNGYTHHCGTTGYNLVYYADPTVSGYDGLNGATYGTALSIAPDFEHGISFVYGDTQCCPQYIKNFAVTDADGTLHDLGQLPGATQYRSVDTSGYLFVNTDIQHQNVGILYDRLGNSDDGAKIVDTNGNFVSINTNAQGVLTGWTDTMGRAMPNPAGATSTTDLSHCPASSSTATLWSPPGPNGGTSQYKFCWATINISFNVGGSHPTSTTATNMVGLVLPNFTAWTFAYDNFGELSTITLPTGGTISYTWTSRYGGCVAPQYIDPDSGYHTLLWPYRRAVTSRTVNANDGTGPHTWSYVMNGLSQTVVTAPPDSNGVQNDTVHNNTGLGGSCSIYETELDQYSGSHTNGTLLKKASTTYNYSPAGPIGNVVLNVVPNTTTTTDLLSGKTSQITKTFDSGVPLNGGWGGIAIYGDLLTQSDYDFTGSSPLRTTNNTYMALSGPTASHYLANNLLSLPYTAQVQNGAGAQMSLTQYSYDETTPVSAGLTSAYQWLTPTSNYRGNNTSVLRWLNSGTLTCQNGHTAGTNSYDTSKIIYFDTGTVQTSADPCGNTTAYDYSWTYWKALPTTVTNALNQAATNTYDFNTSLLASAADPNGLTTSYGYDPLWRLTSVAHPDGALDTITYQESIQPFSATLTTQLNSSISKVEKNIFDGLGRVWHNQLTSDPQDTVNVDTSYDALGRVATVSNPYRNAPDITSSPGTTTYGYDALNRKTTVTYPDGSILSTAYCGPSTLVTDPTGRWRRSRVDGLGRLVEVDEPNVVGASVASNGCPGTGEPIWVTSYTLDALGNLANVLQNGSHQRSFTYDSLSRLLCSGNPETATVACPAFGATTFPTGTLTYVYNPDGVVLTKKDARSLSTNYTYDALHRELTRTYSNGDPTITTAYDGSPCLSPSPSPCQNIGHRTSMTDGAGSEAWSYHVDATNPDTTKRTVHVDQRTTTSGSNNISETTTYYLDFAGNVNHIIYPTSRTVNYTFDSADRPSTATDASNGITYATGFQTPPGSCPLAAVCYTPQGTPYAFSIGQTSSFTGLNVTDSYNSRLQPLEFKASSTGGNAIDISYSFLDPLNNNKNAGHVFQISNNLNSGRNQYFTYDQVNRITSAGTGTNTTGPYCWGYQYSYDPWGNLTSQAGWTPTYSACTETVMAPVTADGNNHISAFGYDVAGNATSEGTNTYNWNAESELKYTVYNGTTTNYTYDGDGRRVSKVGSRLYWYGAGSEILAETDASGNNSNEYIFFGGKRVALLPAGSTAQFYVEDSLGSSRIVTTNTGVVCYDADFYPFGGERPYTDTCTQNNYKFEGKERDTETGNDDFGARYYSNRFGRWLSADWSAVPVAVPYANLTNPQTLNLYAMVADDPESFADLDGHGPNDAPTAGVDPNKQDCSPKTDQPCGQNSGSYNPPAQNQQTPQSLTAQIPSDTRATLAGMIKDSNSPTVDDKTGGFHEEYAVAGLNASGGWVVSRDKPGPYANPDTADHVSPSGKPANQEVANSIVDPRVAAHVHPSGTTATHSWVQGPSGADRAAALPGQINIVFGARDHKVYFYNSAGVIGKPMKLKDFLGQ